jgi:glycosyltransferase involved in cell wall biosynthesis
MPGGARARGGMKRPVTILLGPHREARSGVSTHLNLLFGSRLAEEFSLVHFQVGSEGRTEGGCARLVRLLVSPFCLAVTILARRAAIVHLNTSLNAGAYWRDLAYLVVAKLCGARALYQVHGGALPQQFFARSRALTAFLRGTLQLPDAIVVLAQVELEAYRQFVPRQQVLACPNGIDCADYAKFARARSDTAAPLKLVYLGRLVKEKGLYEALQGLKLAHARGARAQLVLVGSGPEETQLRRFAEELGLAADVSFVPPAFGERKIKLLSDADVLVLASYSEGLPYALLEAMAAGTPAITTGVGGIPDVVSDGVHGLLVPPRDADAIASAIDRLAADRDLLARMSAACRSRIAGGYSLERLSGELRRLYSAMSGSPRH